LEFFSSSTKDDECIALVMSSFFFYDDKDGDDDHCGNKGYHTVYRTVAAPENPKIPTSPLSAIPSLVMVAEERIDNAKPTVAVEKWQRACGN
jgi:hypothetical protein